MKWMVLILIWIFKLSFIWKINEKIGLLRKTDNEGVLKHCEMSVFDELLLFNCGTLDHIISQLAIRFKPEHVIK